MRVSARQAKGREIEDMRGRLNELANLLSYAVEALPPEVADEIRETVSEMRKEQNDALAALDTKVKAAMIQIESVRRDETIKTVSAELQARIDDVSGRAGELAVKMERIAQIDEAIASLKAQFLAQPKQQEFDTSSIHEAIEAVEERVAEIAMRKRAFHFEIIRNSEDRIVRVIATETDDVGVRLDLINSEIEQIEASMKADREAYNANIRMQERYRNLLQRRGQVMGRAN